MLRRIRGQSGSETMLVVSVVVLAVVASSATLIPLFSDGVQNLGSDAKAILADGSVGAARGDGSTGAGSALPGTDPAAGPQDRANANRDMNNQGYSNGASGQSPRRIPQTDNFEDWYNRTIGQDDGSIGNGNTSGRINDIGSRDQIS